MRELRGAPLGTRTTFGVGGPARRLVEAHDEAELVAAARAARAAGEPLVILGGGSNVLVADAGLDATVLVVRTRGVALRRTGRGAVALEAQAGEPWDDLVARCVAEGIAGVECLSGIPGLAGATPIQNVGAYGQDVGQVLREVRALDLHGGEVITLPAAACGLGYRTSRFKGADRGRFVILSVTLHLRPGGPAPPRYGELAAALATAAPTLDAVRGAVLALRRAKGMVLDDADPESRGAGSFFLNPVVGATEADAVEARARAAGGLAAGEAMPRYPAGAGRVKLAAAWLVERAGFRRGQTLGGAAISRRHALALVNRGEATAAEIATLAGEIQRAVRRRLGVTLRPEPVLLGFAPPLPGGLEP